jgi:hypothetical protein
MRLSHFSILLIAGCASSDPSPAIPPAKPGAVTVSVSATGPLTPGPGYFRLLVDTLVPRTIWADSFLVWDDLPADSAVLHLDVLRSHCASDPDSQVIVIPSADTIAATFAVTCWDAYGLVRVDLPASGNNLPTDLGVEVIGVVGTRAAANTAGLGFPLVPAGPQTVQIFDVPANCTVTDSNPQHVIVPLDSIVLRFGMQCS